MNVRLALALIGLVAAPAFAATSSHGHGHGHAGTMMTAQTNASAAMSEGTVRKIDKAAGKMTIAHGPLEGLGMPAMTMVFRVKEAGMLDAVKTGDKIRFQADRVNGVFTVTELETAE